MTETFDHALRRLQGALEGKPDIGADPAPSVSGLFDELLGGKLDEAVREGRISEEKAQRFRDAVDRGGRSDD